MSCGNTTGCWKWFVKVTLPGEGGGVCERIGALDLEDFVLRAFGFACGP